jgi:effector-binding domain-containing protein
MITPLTIEDFKGGDAIVLHLEIPRGDIQKEMPLAIHQIMAAIKEQNLNVAGPMFAHHLNTSGDVFDMNVGFPVRGAVKAKGRVKPGKLPSARVAHVTYTGGYEGLFQAWDEFGTALGTRGCAGSGSILEVYTEGPEKHADPKNWKTDLYVLLKD